MKYLMTITCMILLFSSCHAQKETTNEIVDPITSLPYEITGNTQSVSLPDSLGGADYKGFAGIELIIDDNSQIIKVNISKLKLVIKATGESFVDFQSSDTNIPDNILSYAFFLKNYVVNSLQIEKVGIPEKKNKMILMIRFK